MKKSSAIFTSVPSVKPPRNHFDLSHEVKMSGKFGYLYPILVQETLPGDQISDQITVFLRAAPLLSPVMHRLTVKVNSFFVPYRIICEPWQEFITGGVEGTSTVVLPYITPEQLTIHGTPSMMEVGSLWDYMGLPIYDGVTTNDSDEQISVLPFRAMAKVFNDWFRDPNLRAELALDEELQGDVTQESVNAGIMSLFQRGWRKDYFTSALPWAQRGAEVLIPLAGQASAGDITYRDIASWYQATGSNADPGAVNLDTLAIPPIGDTALEDDTGAALGVHNIDEIDFQNATTTVNDFRMALALQKWAEAQARGGARYIETILSHFATVVQDYRLQRSEYLGGGSQVIRISEVLATAESTGVDVGDMKGHGVSVGKSNRFSYRCPEHGVIISVLSVLPDSAYSQGLDRSWSRKSRFDFAWPLLANLGEQEILSKEVFFSFDQAQEANNNATFGYIPRYAEYKFRNDRIAGDFRTTLGFWHESRFFTSRPILNNAFTTFAENGGGLEESFRRIFAVQDGTDYLWMQVFHNLHAKRPLPFFGVPSL